MSCCFWYTLQHYLKSNSCAHEWDSRIYFSQAVRQSVHNLCQLMQRGLLLKITIQGLMTSNDCNSNWGYHFSLRSELVWRQEILLVLNLIQCQGWVRSREAEIFMRPWNHLPNFRMFDGWIMERRNCHNVSSRVTEPNFQTTQITQWVESTQWVVSTQWAWVHSVGVSSSSECEFTKWVWVHPVGVSSPSGRKFAKWAWENPVGVSSPSE